MSKKKLLCVQRRMGLVLLVVSILTSVVFAGDLTCMLVLVPLALLLLFTKEVIIYHK